MSREGEIAFPRESTSIGYPVPNDQVWNYIQTSCIKQTEQVVFKSTHIPNTEWQEN